MSSDRVAALRACAMPERAEAIEQLGALLGAVQAELLDVITAADLEQDRLIDGATSTEAWLMGLLHVSHATATEWVRVGAALQDLPEIRAALGAGTLAWDQAAPATVYATPATDAELAHDLPGHTAHQITAMARHHRARTRRDAERTQARTAFRWREDRELDGYRYSGFLPAAEGARLNATLEREASASAPTPTPGTGRRSPTAARRRWSPSPTREWPTTSTLPVARESVLRLLCDGQVEFNLDTPDGRTIGIARVSQAVPRWLRRRIALRDGCCRFPGCERPIRHRHHLRWWSKGGPTNANNLIGLCWWDHHVVHEGEWTIEGNPEHVVTFVSPAGRRLRSKPNPLRSDTRRRTLGIVQRDLDDPEP